MLARPLYLEVELGLKHLYDCNNTEMGQIIALHTLYAGSQWLEADDGGERPSSEPTQADEGSHSRWCEFVDQLIAYMRMKTAVSRPVDGCEPTQMEEGLHSRLRERLDQILVHGGRETETLSSDDDDLPELTTGSKDCDLYERQIHELFAAVRFQVSPNDFAYKIEIAKKRAIRAQGKATKSRRTTDNRPGLPSPTVNAEAGVHLGNRGTWWSPTEPLDPPQTTSTRSVRLIDEAN